MKTSFNITGISDVNRVLEEIAPREGMNLMRAVVRDIASQLAKAAKLHMGEDSGAMKAGTKSRPRRGERGMVRATVEVVGAFYWRFEEYGQGPSGVERAMFLKALMEMQPEMDRIYLETFVRKYEASLARKRKSA